jgi:hypothetical protein
MAMARLLRFFAGFTALLPVLACSSGPARSSAGSGSGSATGAVGGAPLAVHSALSVHVTQDLGEEWAVLLLDEPFSCPDLQNAVRTGSWGSQQPSVLALTVISSNLGGGALTPIGPGTYSAASGGSGSPGGTTTNVFASYTKAQPGSGCSSNADDATDGTITISAVDASHIAGSYALTFPDGSLQGTFDAPTCDVPLTGAADAGCSP